jgi:integrase
VTAPPGRGSGLFVRLVLATGARRGELLKLTWADVGLKAGSILLRETKNGEDRRVPLIGEARARLLDWAKVRRLDDARVFPGSSPDTAPPGLDLEPSQGCRWGGEPSHP